MKFELRPLKADDAFMILNLIGKLNLIETFKDVLKGKERDNIIEFAKGATEEDRATDVGVSVFLKLSGAIIDKVPQHKTEIYQLLADVYQTDVATLKEISIQEFIELLVGFFKHEDFKRLWEYMNQSLE